MDKISFDDLPKDVYKIIIDKMIVNLSIDDFKNYTLADNKSLLDDYIKNYINKIVLNLHIKKYLNFIDDFAIENKVHMQKKFDEYYNSLPSENFSFYNSMINDVVNSNYFNYNNDIKTIIQNNLENLIPFYMTHYPRSQYYHIIDRLLNIYNIRGKNQFRISFMIFVSRLKQDLINYNISKNDTTQIIIKVIKTFDWNNINNKLIIE